MKTKITHLTSAHPRYDTRIFFKECQSLSKVEAYQVNLVVADGLGDEVKHLVSVYDVGKPEGRSSRIFTTTKKVLEKAIALDSHIYHLHDPELIPVGLKLKKLGKKVIFDAHEDLPKQILAKHYLPAFMKRPLSYFVSKAEVYALKKFDYVLTATPMIREKFSAYNILAEDINNFPKMEELLSVSPEFFQKRICYIGLLYETRGIRELIEAIEPLDARLTIAGKFFDRKFEKEMKNLKGWEKVDFKGFVDRNGIKEILEDSVAGMVTLHPTPSYVEAYPVKMFEYMGAGIAVIASNFPLYRMFIEENHCGVCVDPLNVEMIREAIQSLTQNLPETKKMGENGKQVVQSKYNWTIEEQKLWKIYREVLHVH